MRSATPTAASSCSLVSGLGNPALWAPSPDSPRPQAPGLARLSGWKMSRGRWEGWERPLLGARYPRGCSFPGWSGLEV